jgi:cysteine synthase
MNILQAIGNTSIVRLRKVVPAHCADILVKLEWENPTGSMKDRMAQAVISRAEQDGRLKPGGTVVEYTGGSTGASLALICAAKGYRIRIELAPVTETKQGIRRAATLRGTTDSHTAAREVGLGNRVLSQDTVISARSDIAVPSDWLIAREPLDA